MAVSMQIGPNGGPSFEPGFRWRKPCWQQARARLLSTLPMEGLRRRINRAREWCAASRRAADLPADRHFAG